MTIVTDYIDNLVPPEKELFTHIRELVYELIPDTEDAYSYGIPTYKYKGKYMMAFASYENFLSIYPGGEVVSRFKEELKEYKTSRGTISFTIEHPLPDDLLKKIILVSKEAIEHRLKK